VGQILFSGLELGVRPGRVMIPRPATEGLVAEALERLGSGHTRVADVGTGSGAIAIAIADRAPQAEVWATDTSLAAVSLARANTRRHGVADRVTVCHADLLEGVPGPLDLVVANLPYLPEAQAGLFPELASEPPTAVFADGDGLHPYRRLVAACTTRLRPDGSLVVQFHRRVLAAERSELRELQAALEERAWEETARLAA
jgi:release factor glutamine methyltransferase